MNIESTAKVQGWTEVALFDKDGKAKKLFHTNAIWKFIKAHFSIDLKLPVITGLWSTSALKYNTITATGKKACAQQIGGTTTTPVTAIALGTGTPSTTALGTEITTSGGERGAATVSNQTTSTSGDTERWIKTFTFSGSLAITEEGLFDNNTSGGTMLASQTFSAINVVSTDTLQITHNVKFA